MIASWRREAGHLVYEQIRSQPEFNEQLWQYLNRRVSDWRLTEARRN